VRHLAVDEVENVGDDHDHAGEDEAIDGKRPGGNDIDEDTDQCEQVGVDAERDARVDDRAQRQHADGADRACESHRLN
jgi:hypothetical protein